MIGWILIKKKLDMPIQSTKCSEYDIQMCIADPEKKVYRKLVKLRQPRKCIGSLAHSYEKLKIIKIPRYVSGSDDIENLGSTSKTSLSCRGG